jgi:hypothetical protein
VSDRTGAPSLRHEVYRRIVEHGEPLDQVEEELIDPSAVPADHRAALWLYAWSLQSAAQQRHEALRFLAELESAEQTD